MKKVFKILPGSFPEPILKSSLNKHRKLHKHTCVIRTRTQTLSVFPYFTLNLFSEENAVREQNAPKKEKKNWNHPSRWLESLWRVFETFWLTANNPLQSASCHIHFLCRASRIIYLPFKSAKLFLLHNAVVVWCVCVLDCAAHVFVNLCKMNSVFFFLMPLRKVCAS